MNRHGPLQDVSPLPFANPSTGFHNTIRYLPSSFAFSADGVLLAEYNSTTMAVALYLTAMTSSPIVSDAALVSTVTFAQVGGTKATWPADRMSVSAMKAKILSQWHQSSCHPSSSFVGCAKALDCSSRV